jgi:hypothetical protein
MEVLREAGGAIETGGCEEGLLTDVRDLIWQFAIRDPVEPLPEEAELETYLARRTLALARTCLDDSSVWERDALDPWACLRAAESECAHRAPGGGGFGRRRPLLAPRFETRGARRPNCVATLRSSWPKLHEIDSR